MILALFSFAAGIGVGLLVGLMFADWVIRKDAEQDLSKNTEVRR